MSFLVKNTQISYFSSQILAFLLSREILQIDKFEGADFKYDDTFFQIFAQNTKIRRFWSKILK